MFAASEPLDEATLKDRLPTDIELEPLIAELRKQYEGRGVQLLNVGGRWQFRTAPDLAFLMEKERIEPKKRVAGQRSKHWPSSPTTSRSRASRSREIRGVSVRQGDARRPFGDRMGAPAGPPPHARDVRSATAPAKGSWSTSGSKT